MLNTIANNILIAKAENIGVCIDGNKNKPFIPEVMKKFLI